MHSPDIINIARSLLYSLILAYTIPYLPQARMNFVLLWRKQTEKKSISKRYHFRVRGAHTHYQYQRSTTHHYHVYHHQQLRRMWQGGRRISLETLLLLQTREILVSIQYRSCVISMSLCLCSLFTYHMTLSILYSNRECQATHRRAHKKVCPPECLIMPDPDEIAKNMEDDIFMSPMPRGHCKCGHPLCDEDQPSPLWRCGIFM